MEVHHIIRHLHLLIQEQIAMCTRMHPGASILVHHHPRSAGCILIRLAANILLIHLLQKIAGCIPICLDVNIRLVHQHPRIVECTRTCQDAIAECIQTCLDVLTLRPYQQSSPAQSTLADAREAYSPTRPGARLTTSPAASRLRCGTRLKRAHTFILKTRRALLKARLRSPHQHESQP